MSGERRPERVSLMDELAKSMVGMGPDWQPFKYEAIRGNDNPIMIVGAMAPVFTSGKNKGRRNWKKRDVSSERTIVVTNKDRRRFEDHWSDSTGLCPSCVGHGDVVRGWSIVDGTRYEKCKRCSGTGKRAEVQP